MTFTEAISQFTAQSLIFVLIAGFATKIVAKKDSFLVALKSLGLSSKFEPKHFRLGLFFGLLIPFIQLSIIVITGYIVSLFIETNFTTIIHDYYGAIVNSSLNDGGLMNTIIIMIVMILFVGVGEEVFFRGMIQDGLSYKLGNRKGLIITAIIFTLMHGFYMLPKGAAFASAFALFSISIIFGLLKQRTGSLVPSIIAHGFGNALIYGFFADIFYRLV